MFIATANRCTTIPYFRYFYPRSPCGERLALLFFFILLPYFYPRSPCGERPHPIGVLITVIEISIHALLAESDSLGKSETQSDPVFLSTLSLRRATFSAGREYDTEGYFYPRSPCGERPAWNRFTQRRDFISIHALLAESDVVAYIFAPHEIFLYNLSLQRATAGSWAGAVACRYFYPRSPCGERRRLTGV